MAADVLEKDVVVTDTALKAMGWVIERRLVSIHVWDGPSVGIDLFGFDIVCTPEGLERDAFAFQGRSVPFVRVEFARGDAS